MMSVSLSAQVGLGSIRGKILDGDNNDLPVPNARVWIEVGGEKRIVICDVDGRFDIMALNPGVYNLYAKSSGKDTSAVMGIIVDRDMMTTIDDISMTSNNMLGCVFVTYSRPLIPKEVSRIEIPIEDIAHSPLVRDPKALFASMNSDIIIKEGTGEMIIRGSRPGDVIYYIDGVKVTDLTGIPGAAIGGMMGYTGGIPAKYGDTTGGIVALETRSYFDLYYAWKARQQ